MNKKRQSLLLSKERQYFLAQFWKVILGRFLDYLLVNSMIFFFSWILYADDNLTFIVKTIINYFLAFLILILYFVIFPYFFQGKTLFKFFFSIYLVQKNYQKISILHLIYREFFITFIPWMILIINLWIFTFIMSDNNTIDISQLFFKDIKAVQLPIAYVITMRITILFYAMWYLILIILLRLDEVQQLFFDRYLSIYIVKKVKVAKIKNKKAIVNKSNISLHSHLQKNLPAIIDNEKLEEIENL